MKNLLLVMALISAPAFAGTTDPVLNCKAAQGINGQAPLEFHVYYQRKSGNFGGYLGFNAAAEGPVHRDIFYCYGACGKMTRSETATTIQVSVEDRSLVSPSLDQKLEIEFPKSLLSPGAQGIANINVDLLAYGHEGPATLVQYSGQISCVANVAIAHIVDTH
jgi:hypothetical protein